MREPKEVVRERERRVWELRQQCWTQERIAEELGLNQSSVSKILKRLSDRYLSQIQDDVARIKAEQVAQLNHIADEAMQAWERSKEASKLLQKRTRGAPRQAEERAAARATAVEEVVTLRTQDEDGDPRYLAQAMSALADIRKVMGADAPLKQEQTVTVPKPIKVETDVDTDRMAAILSVLAEVGAIPAGAGAMADAAPDGVYPAPADTEAGSVPAAG